MPTAHTVERTFVGLGSPTAGRAGAGGHQCQGIYHAPEAVRPKTAFIATHYNVDFSEHYLAEHLAARGFGFLGWNTRFRGAEAYFLLDRAIADIGLGMRWLEHHGVDRIVLLGNSGGGSLMAAYHSQSQQLTMQPAQGRALAEGLDELPRADMFVFVAAHPGRPEVLTDWMDPSLVVEDDPLSRDPELDMYDERHGPPYSAEFVDRYRAAQHARNDRLTARCRARLAELNAAGLDDQLFVMRRTWADLRFVDGSLDPSARATPLCYAGNPKRANDGVLGIGTVNTLRTWLDMWSLRDSQCRGALHLPRLDLPTLLIQPDADCGVFPSQARTIFDAVGSADKEYVTMPGDHYFVADATLRPAVADRIVAWLADHGVTAH
ncbi:MAG TPA: hypothetical protein VH761_15925 [Ilumatobacteraceae bacterium]